MRSLRECFVILVLVGYVASRPPSSDIYTDNHHSDPNPAVQDGVHTPVHEVEEGAEADPSLTKEHVLEPDQEIEEDGEYAVDEEGLDDEVSADKRGSSSRRNHGRKSSHNVTQKGKRSERSSEEDKLDLLNPDHIPHKRSPHGEDCLHDEHTIMKRSTGQGVHEEVHEEDDGSFDGLEYIEELEKEVGSREKRSHTHHEPEEEQEAETEELPNFPSDINHNVESVALRVKRVSKAGSSHRNRLLAKSKGNSRAGQGEDEQPAVIKPL